MVMAMIMISLIQLITSTMIRIVRREVVNATLFEAPSRDVT